MCKQVIYGKYKIRIIKFLSNFLGTRNPFLSENSVYYAILLKQ